MTIYEFGPANPQAGLRFAWSGQGVARTGGSPVDRSLPDSGLRTQNYELRTKDYELLTALLHVPPEIIQYRLPALALQLGGVLVFGVENFGYTYL